MHSGYIIIGADTVPTSSNEEYFINGDIDKLFGKEIINYFKEAEYSMLNLEVPLCDKVSPIKKYGPNLISSSKCVCGLKRLGISLLLLSNNHILDQGQDGLQDTLTVIRNENIEYIGISRNYDDYDVIKYIKLDDSVIAIYNCSEHEFSSATSNKIGATPFDEYFSYKIVMEAKKKADYVFVIYHGGIEHYRYPSPRIQRIARQFVENGSDLVIVQHSHCVGCFEKYMDSTIVYGQGNFIFDRWQNDCWDTGILLEIRIENNVVNVTPIPVVRKGAFIRLAHGETKTKILSDLKKRSEDILMDGFVDNEFCKFSMKQLKYYETHFLGRISKSILFRAINKFSNGKFAEWILDEESRLIIKNYFMCESHKELIEKGIIK